MMKISENLLRYLMVHTRRKSRLAFSSRDALSLILIAGLPFVMVSSISMNKSVHRNVAYAYASTQPSTGLLPADAERVGRQAASQVSVNPAALLKMNGPLIALMFSKPGLQRAEGDMGVWQYRTHDCVLDLYIADQGKGDVVHYETRARVKASDASNDAAMDGSDSRACVKSVFNGHDGITPMVFASN